MATGYETAYQALNAHILIKELCLLLKFVCLQVSNLKVPFSYYILSLGIKHMN